MPSLADLPELIGFFSYSRDDDDSYRGRLSALREAIQHELSAQLGRTRKNFRLWQDHEAIAPGRLWEAEIKTAVEQSVFFIPIVTPRGVNSQYCHYEFESFLAREKALGRTDLVFPILYVPVPALEDEAKWRDHPVLSAIARRQYVDWQTFRYADAPTPAMREEIARFARNITEALHRPWLSPQERERAEEAAAQERAESERRRQETGAKQRAEEAARRRNEEAEAQRLAQERRQQDVEAARRAEEDEQRHREAQAKREAEEERAFAAAKAEPRPAPSRRAILIGGGAAGAGILAAAGVIANRLMQSEQSGSSLTPLPDTSPGAPAAPAAVKPDAAGTVKIGFANPLSGAFAALGANQLRGCEVALDQLNAKNGVLGRQVALVSYDTPEPANASSVAARLIDADKVDALIGNVSSAAALAMIQVSSQRSILHLVTGARSDEITGSQCRWNVFRLGSTTSLQASAICPALFKAYGKSWYVLTSDFAFGRNTYQNYEANLKKLGGRVVGSGFVPLGSTDFTSFLLQAKATNPDVLVLLLQGTDLVNCLKQSVELGLQRQLHIGGNQIDLETVAAMPSAARFGTWMLDWYWKQAAGTPGLDAFVAAVRKRTGKVPTAQTWFGYAAIQAYALACEAAKTTDSKAVARALTNMALPLDIRMQPNSAYFRGTDHQLFSSLFIGDLLPQGDGDPENLVKVTSVVAGANIAPPPAETGCKMQLPT
jgi:branched-chain amino acid transport system substrate-binding protein